MPATNTQSSTSAPDAAPVLPSILQLGLLVRALSDRGHAFDEARSKAKDHTPEYMAAEKGAMLAFEREGSVQELVNTLPAQTLDDAAVQLVFAFKEVDFLQAFQLTLEEIDVRVSKVRRLLASILPVVARSAGLTIEQIGGEGIENLLRSEHPTMEA